MRELAPFALPVLLLVACLAGWRVQRALPGRHRGADTVDAVRLILGMLVTFTALVLGLLTGAAKQHFDAVGGGVQAFGTGLIQLEQRLREYGPEGDPVRTVLRRYTAAALADTWPDEPAPPGDYPAHPGRLRPGSEESLALGQLLLDADRMVAALDPATPIQRALLPTLSARMTQTLQDRWTLVGLAVPTLSWPFLLIMTGWLLLVFLLFGLSAPGNPVVVAALLATGLSLSVAVWLIAELDSPLSGLLQVSSFPLREALQHMDMRG